MQVIHLSSNLFIEMLFFRGTRSFLFGKGKDNGEAVGGGREGSNGGLSDSHEMVNGDPVNSNLPGIDYVKFDNHLTHKRVTLLA